VPLQRGHLAPRVGVPHTYLRSGGGRDRAKRGVRGGWTTDTNEVKAE
jgi:hypothetical protein